MILRIEGVRVQYDLYQVELYEGVVFGVLK